VICRVPPDQQGPDDEAFDDRVELPSVPELLEQRVHHGRDGPEAVAEVRQLVELVPGQRIADLGVAPPGDGHEPIGEQRL
jgi:hypothetical protein